METICIHQVSWCGNLPLLGVSKYKETHSFPRIGNVRNLTGNVRLQIIGRKSAIFRSVANIFINEYSGSNTLYNNY